MEHQLPPLPYEKNALQPYMSRETLEFHYGRHHQTYISNLNRMIVGTDFSDIPLEEIVRKSSGAIFNNAAQVWNHNFFWNCLSSNRRHFPTGNLEKAINAMWGSYDKFKHEFTNMALAVFGSGWTWLIQKEDATLEIVSTSNAHLPFPNQGKPLLVVDVWEHAYYIDYRNERAKFLEAFWKIANWDFAEQNFSS